MANRTGGEALVERLSLHGVDLLFGIISIHNLDIFDALHRYRDRVRHIGGRSELGCGFMADGYARSSGRPGVLVTSTGPGAANSMHAVGEAYHSSSPLLHLTTTVARGEREQGLGLIHEPKKQFRMLRSVTGHARRVEDPADLAPAVDEAFAALSAGRRRPSVLQFPHDLLGSPCGPGGRRPPPARTGRGRGGGGGGVS
ncbi:MAG: thiamine pyrophosphate-binding protein [Acidobacteriota bacterium]|nr:thiamine pyrophosphate-binding protein [Acidobacteriota bacterium]